MSAAAEQFVRLEGFRLPDEQLKATLRDIYKIVDVRDLLALAALVRDDLDRLGRSEANGQAPRPVAVPMSEIIMRNKDGSPARDPSAPGLIDAIVEQPLGFVGRTHAEVLDLDFGDEPPDLIDGLVPRGVVVTTAGLPETYKGWICAKKADVIARGEGEVLGCAAMVQGPVGYFWQDDSERMEAERVQLYSRVHGTPRDLPIRWFLNEGLQLPRDIERLLATIVQYELVYVVLDSFYNVASEIELKERAAGIVFAQLKTEVCDHTGCTIDIVDHMPWANDVNRKRLRGYGDVFKNAASRAGLYIDADGSKLYVEARGNNIRGFKRTPAYWDADALELRLLEPHDIDTEALDANVLKHVTEYPGDSTKKVEEAVEGGRESIRAALERLAISGDVATAPGRHPSGKYWYPRNHPVLNSPGDTAATLGETLLDTFENGMSPDSPTPRRGGESFGDTFEELASTDENSDFEAVSP